MNRINPSSPLILSHREIKELLSRGQNPYWPQLNADLVKRLFNDYDRWPDVLISQTEPGRGGLGPKAQHIINFMRYDIQQIVGRLTLLKEQFGMYSKRFAQAQNDDEKRQHILTYARTLGATRRQQLLDGRAFKRWFGHDTVCDRYHRRYLESERYLSFVLECLGAMSALVIQSDYKSVGYSRLWQRLDLEPVLIPLLDYDGDKRVVISAFKALTVALRALPEDLQHRSVSETSLRFIYHSCFKGSQNIWVQCEALTLLQTASPRSLKIVLSKRLQYPKYTEDLFVRRKVVQIIAEQLSQEPELAGLFGLVLEDPCPSVRQKLAQMLPQTAPMIMSAYYPPLLFDDAAAPVRGEAVLSLLASLQQADCFDLALGFLRRSLDTETDRFVLRTGLHVCSAGLIKLLENDTPFPKTVYLDTLLPALKHLHENAPALAIRRYAAQTREALLMYGDDKRYAHIKGLQKFVNTIPAGKTRRIPKHLLASDDPELGRLLSVLAQKDFGFDVENTLLGRFITRGHVFGFRIWRFLYEFRHPSPDKRQAFEHTLGRLFWGRMRVPSAILSELAETKVPGEPLFMDTEDGWRGYLPLVDEVISALAIGSAASHFYHSEGITELTPPRNLVRRILASWKITWSFADYARLRNWQEKSQLTAQSYVNALSELGIQVSFKAYEAENPAYQS